MWTEEEVRVVRQKVREMVIMENWRGARGSEGYQDTVPRSDSGLFRREIPPNFSIWDNKYCIEGDNWPGCRINDFMKMQSKPATIMINIYKR